MRAPKVWFAWAVALAWLGLVPPGLAQSNLDAGKSAAQIFADTCNACHRFMDPIGLSLDSFDVTGRWRERENGMTLDTAGDFYDGTKITSSQDLINVLLKRPTPIVRNFTENLMAYGLGRRVEYYDQPAIRQIVRQAAADVEAARGALKQAEAVLAAAKAQLAQKEAEYREARRRGPRPADKTASAALAIARHFKYRIPVEIGWTLIEITRR